MYRLMLITGILLFTVAGCKKEKTPPQPQTISETISMGAKYANDVFYSLSDGVVATPSRDSWDIAFATKARSSSVITNAGAGVKLYVYPTDASWAWGNAIDTTGITGWNPLWNSDTIWEEGAFNRNATGYPNYGWGIYDMTTHNLNGSALYVIKLINGDYKQIFIDKKYSVEMKYDFRYADLDGSNEQIVSLDLSGFKEKNYLYYSLVKGEQIDREPLSSSWDLLFTRYYNEDIHYFVTGVLSNMNIQTIEKRGVDPAQATYLSTEFSDNISIIGYDWKSFDMSTFSYTVADSLCFFVKTANEKVYKIAFTGFEGSSTGNITFDKTEMQ